MINAKQPGKWGNPKKNPYIPFKSPDTDIGWGVIFVFILSFPEGL